MAIVSTQPAQETELKPGMKWHTSRVFDKDEKCWLEVARVQVPESATIDESAHIWRGVKIGEGVQIGPGVRIYPDSEIGSGTTIGGNTNIWGSKIGKNSTIGSGVVIHASTLGLRTHIGAEAKLAHCHSEANVKLGSGVVVGSQNGPRVNIGRGTALEAKATARKGVKIGKKVTVTSGVEIKSGAVIADETFVDGRVLPFMMVKTQDGVMQARPMTEGQIQELLASMPELVPAVRGLLKTRDEYLKTLEAKPAKRGKSQKSPNPQNHTRKEPLATGMIGVDDWPSPAKVTLTGTNIDGRFLDPREMLVRSR